MRGFLLLCLLLSLPAKAATVSRIYDFEPNTKAEADQVDEELDNIISTLNGNINNENILDGGIATADLGSGVVTTAKIASGNVTRSRLEPLGQQFSGDTGLMELLEGSDWRTATGVSVSITTTGRPVFVGLTGASTNDTTHLPYVVAGNNTSVCRMRVIRSNVPAIHWVAQGQAAISLLHPASAFSGVDATSSGTYVYQLQVWPTNSGAICQLGYLRMIVYEL